MDVIRHLKLLVNLAWADGSLADRERNYITNIAKAHGVAEHDTAELLQGKHNVMVPNQLNPDEKFDVIFALVQLMKIDERMYQEEISYCTRIAGKLGYTHEAIFDLMLDVRGGKMTDAEKEKLKRKTQNFLKS